MTALVTRATSPAGDPAWLAEDYATVKALLDDPRLGRSHADPENASRFTDAAVLGKPTGSPETEKAEHQAMRRLLTPAFSARRMAKLRSRVQELVDDLLDQLAEAGSPADLHEMLAFPLPALVICELLGVPYEDRDDFRRWSDDSADMRDRARAEAADAQLKAYASKLLERKLAEPAEDVLTDLAQAQRAMPDVMSDARVIQLAAGLLWAGHETTVSAIDRGVVLLLRNPEQLAAIKADPDLVSSAVEEIMRLPSPVAQGSPGRLARWATDDIEIDDVVIRRGDLVMLGLERANLAEAMFADARTFDITRKNNAHLGFGHGPHFCIGAPLARTELQSVFGTLFVRFPNLRLAVPFEELRPRDYMLTGGLQELPVAW